MGIFDVFTGDPAKEAAQQQRGYLSGVQGTGNYDINAGLANATGAVTGGTRSAMDVLGQGYQTGVSDINAGTNQGLGYIDQGTADARGLYGQARGSLSDLGGKYGAGTSLYLDALGVNGPEGNARATGAFQAGPGYDFTLGQGINAISRLRNAQGAGSGVGGNADRDATTYATGLANQTYGDWRNSLGGLVNPELAATQGAAGYAGQEAGLLSSAGQNKAQLASNRGAMLSDLAKQWGTGAAGLYTGEGNALAGLETGAAGQKVGLGTALASPYSKTYGEEAAAEMQGSKNLWDFGQNLAALGTGQYGKAAGASGGTGTNYLKSLFGGA